MAAEHVLVVVSEDPERSHRANEAIRIALGILAGENAVTLVLLGPATKILSAEIEEYVDGEDTLKHVATLKKLGQRFHVERSAIDHAGGSADWNADGPEVVPITTDELAGLIGRSDRVLIF